MVPLLGIIATVGLFSVVVAIGFFVYYLAKTAKMHRLIVSKLKENRSISNSDLKAFLVTQGVNMPLDELSLRRTKIETSLDELLKQEREHVLLERSRGIRLIVTLEVIGGFFYLALGIIELLAFAELMKFSGSTEILGIPISLLSKLFVIFGLTFMVLSISGFYLVFRFWSGKDSARTRGLVHSCVCLAIGILTLPIRILSILIYAAIIY
jgi:hypothetical protein